LTIYGNEAQEAKQEGGYQDYRAGEFSQGEGQKVYWRTSDITDSREKGHQSLRWRQVSS